MLFYLMHKNINVALLDIDETGRLNQYLKSNNSKHIPIGGQLNNMKFYEWWQNRAVPETRKGARQALEKLGYINTSSVLVNNLALSLNDCYWIKPVGKNITWEDINLYSNNFVDVFGELTFNPKANSNNKSLYATVQGNLQKKWLVDNNGDRVLLKGNWGSSIQQSVNEVFVSRLCRKLCIDCVRYELVKLKIDDGSKANVGCVCKNFCTSDIESVSLWEICQLSGKKGSESYYNWAVRNLIASGLVTADEIDRYFDTLVVLDFLISNTDRHFNNIAVLRNSNSLRGMGFAPIYDSGSSMFFRSNTYPFANLRNIKTSGMYKKEIDGLKVVNDRHRINLDKLLTREEFHDIYKILHDSEREEYLWKLLCNKATMINDFQKGKDIWKYRGYNT